MDSTKPPAVLSVVIPVLNESTYIQQTLLKLVAQSEVDEVLVVDNGSDDGTVEIVERFATEHPKVRLLHEQAIGVTPARNRGFDAATGEFIARTDADTLVSDDWAATVCRAFRAYPDVGALTGLCTYYDSPVGWFLRFGQWLLVRAGRLGGRVGNMFGPNMAIRREAWLKVRDHTQNRADVVDDLELALCLTKCGIPIVQLTDMRAETSARRRCSSPVSRWHFHAVGLRTLRDHGIPVRAVDHLLVFGAWLAHTVQWPVYCLWDFERRRFSLRPGRRRACALAPPATEDETATAAGELRG